MPGSHSSVVGGSNAARVLNCPGSTNLLARIPAAAETPSGYATEGTALHTLISDLIQGRLKMSDIRKDETTVAVPGEGSILLTTELFHRCLLPAMAHYLHITDEDRVDTRPLVERNMNFPGIEGAHGTCDLILRSEARNRTRILDWKFGFIPVTATEPDPEDPTFEVINPQLLFYAACARHEHPELFPPGVEIVLSVFQPRHYDPGCVATETIVSQEELTRFVEGLASAVLESRDSRAPIQRGSWCRFAECKVICPAHQGPTFKAGQASGLVREDPDYLEKLVWLLDRGPLIEEVLGEARRQAQALLEDGHDIPGWKLVMKRANRQWTLEPEELARALRKLRVRKADLYERTLKSPAGVEKILPRGVKLPEGIALARSTGTTLAPETDERPAVNRRKTFGVRGPEALAQLLGKS